MPATVVWMLAALLSAAGPSAAEGKAISGVFACYSDGFKPYLKIVFRLDEKPPHLASFGGKRLAGQADENGAYEVYQRDASEQFFDIMEYKHRRQALIHSYVYYMTEADYAQSFGARDGGAKSFKTTYHNPELFALIPQQPKPENTVHIGWNKTLWNCKPIASWLYLPYLFWSLVLAFMSA